MESFAASKRLDARASSLSPDVFVDMTIPEPLVDSREPDVIDVVREELRKHFPVADVTQEHDYGRAGAQLAMCRLEVFRFEMSRHVFRWHRTHLDAADQIGAEVLEMPPDNSSHFPRRFFLRKGDLKITSREPAIVWKEQPGAKAHEISDSKQNAQRKCAHDCCARAVQKVNAEIEHAESALGAGEAGQRKFACVGHQSI
jgi:hypothetical protein